MRVLVINDFVRKGGAEEVYRMSVDVLRARNDVSVETFDEHALPGGENIRRARVWSRATAHALGALLDRFRPQRILVHNYHNRRDGSATCRLANRVTSISPAC